MNKNLSFSFLEKKADETRAFNYSTTIDFVELEEAVDFIANQVINDEIGYRPCRVGLAQTYVLFFYYSDIMEQEWFKEMAKESDVAGLQTLFDLVDDNETLKDEFINLIDKNSWVQLLKYSDDLIAYHKSIRPVDKVAMSVGDILSGIAELMENLNSSKFVNELKGMNVTELLNKLEDSNAENTQQ